MNVANPNSIARAARSSSVSFRLAPPHTITSRFDRAEYGKVIASAVTISAPQAQRAALANHVRAAGLELPKYGTIMELRLEQTLAARRVEKYDILNIFPMRVEKLNYGRDLFVIVCEEVEIEAFKPKASDAKIDGLPSQLCDRLKKLFGKDFVAALHSSPEMLAEKTRFSPVKREIILSAISTEINARRSDKRLPAKITKALRAAGENLSTSRALAKHWKPDAPAYQFLLEGKQSFLKADRFVSALGHVESSHRNRAIIIDALLQRAKDPGDTVVSFKSLCSVIWRNFAITREAVEQACAELIDAGVVSRFEEPRQDPLFEPPQNSYLVGFRPLVEAEQRIAEFLDDNAHTPLIGRKKRAVEFAIANAAELLGHENFVLDEQQADAVRAAFEYRASIITGPPGSGKTAILAVIHAAARILFSDTEAPITCAALSGRAASVAASAAAIRVGEDIIPFPAATIHRTFGLAAEAGDDVTELVSPNKIDCGVFASEESSMTNSALMKLMLASVCTSHFVFVGDANQLDPIGAGRPFADMIASGALPVTTLAKNHRTGVSGIRDLCRDLLEQDETEYGYATEFDEDFARNGVAYIEAPSSRRGDEAARLWRSLRKKASDNDIVVLTPLNIGDDGTARLNDDIRKGLGRGPRVEKSDIVLITKNNYTARNERNGDPVAIFNGERAVVDGVYDDMIVLAFAGNEKQDERRVQLMKSDSISGLPENVTFGYAMTVHKAQGSQFPHVAVVTLKHRNVSKSSVYTAASRAVVGLTIIGDAEELFASAGKPTPPRNTLLARLLTKRERL